MFVHSSNFLLINRTLSSSSSNTNPSFEQFNAKHKISSLLWCESKSVFLFLYVCMLPLETEGCENSVKPRGKTVTTTATGSCWRSIRKLGVWRSNQLQFKILKPTLSQPSLCCWTANTGNSRSGLGPSFAQMAATTETFRAVGLSESKRPLLLEGEVENQLQDGIAIYEG